MCHDDVTSVEQIAHGRHVELPASEFRHRKAMRGLCMRVDVAGRLTKALVGRDLPEPGVLPLQEKPCKLNDFVVASEGGSFSVDDQYVHVAALRSVDADAFICFNLERSSILERSASAGQSVDADFSVAGESRAPAIVARPVKHSVSPHKTRTPRFSGVRQSAGHATVMTVAPETKAEPGAK